MQPPPATKIHKWGQEVISSCSSLPKAEHKLVDTLPLRPGKDPNQAPHLRIVKNIICCNTGCREGHAAADCKRLRRCKGCASPDHYWMKCPYWCQIYLTLRHIEGVCHYVPVGKDKKYCTGSYTERLNRPGQMDAYKKGKSDCEQAIKDGYYERVGSSVRRREAGRQGLSESRSVISLPELSMCLLDLSLTTLLTLA